MKNLLIFSSGNGVFHGIDFLIEKMTEIQNLRKKVHDNYKILDKEGLSEEQIHKKLVKLLFKKESVLDKLTQGDLSRKNLILSLLNWSLENKKN